MRNPRKKKRSVISVLIHNLIATFFWCLVLFGMGLGSYNITMNYYNTTGGPKDEKITSMISDYFEQDAKVESISKNLILGQDEQGKITRIVLEIFNTTTHNLDYITIPVDTQFTVSNELYQKLCEAKTGVPQIVCLKETDNYFKDRALYEYMVVLIEDMLKIDVSYYTAISEAQFDWVFTETKETIAIPEEETVMKDCSIYKISENFMNETKGLTDKKTLKNYLKEEAKEYSSDLALRGKYEYVEAYLKIREEYIYAYTIYGLQKENYFDVALEQSAILAKEVIENTIPHMQEQVIERVEQISSKGYSIEILNASGIDGLAASYQQLLTEQGYNITHVGNYTIAGIRRAFWQRVTSIFSALSLLQRTPRRSSTTPTIIGTPRARLSAQMSCWRPLARRL